MNKKIAVTGHTKGIGKSIVDLFSLNNFHIMGFSRSNGYDIGEEKSRTSIIEQLDNVDIFINNAYHPQGQTFLLAEVIKKFSGTDKIIVNISSKMIYYPNSGFEDYISAKKAQNDIVKKHMFNNKPKILNIIVGAVDTDMAKVWLSEKINPDTLAKFIYDMVQYQNTLAIQEVVIDVPGLNWGNVKYAEHNKSISH